MGKKIIVVGCSSGVGKELVLELLKSGNTVALIDKKEKEIVEIAKDYKNNSLAIKHDVTEFQKSEEVFNNAIQKMDGLDEIYYVAGVMEKVEIDEFNIEKDLRMMNVNILGAIAFLNPAAKYFQSKGKGKIIGISSIAGDRGRVKSPVYNTSKAALTTYLEALRNRLARKGIQVLTVRPGFIDTDMTKGMEGLFWLISASKAAQAIIKAANKGKENIYLPGRWRLVALIIIHIPSFIFKKMSI